MVLEFDTHVFIATFGPRQSRVSGILLLMKNFNGVCQYFGEEFCLLFVILIAHSLLSPIVEYNVWPDENFVLCTFNKHCLFELMEKAVCSVHMFVEMLSKRIYYTGSMNGSHGSICWKLIKFAVFVSFADTT